MKAKLIKKDDHYFLEVEPYKWTPLNEFPAIVANTFDKPKGDILQLSLKNCQAIERGYDLDELFNEVDESIDYHEFDFTSFRFGFQKAVELMGDKKFSDADVKLAIHLAWDDDDLTTTEIIQSLHQNEWDVDILEVENDEVYSVSKNMKVAHNKAFDGVLFKYDVDGCLILKRKVT